MIENLSVRWYIFKMCSDIFNFTQANPSLGTEIVKVHAKCSETQTRGSVADTVKEFLVYKPDFLSPFPQKIGPKLVKICGQILF